MRRSWKRLRPQPPAVLGALYLTLYVLFVLGGWDQFKQPHLWVPVLIDAVVFAIVLAFIIYRARRKSRAEDPPDL